MLPMQNPATKNTMVVVVALLMAAAAYLAGSRMSRAIEGNPQIRLTAAEKALAAGNGRLALSLFQPLADTGNAEADYWLADIYGHGIGVAADPAKALAYLKAAAAKGWVPAEARLGQMYVAGDATVQDFGEAQTWLAKAAIKGDAASERGLGTLYEKGLGVARDPIAAYAWYENAVLRGDIPAARLRDRVVAQLAPDSLAKAEARAKSLDAEIGPAIIPVA